MDDQQKRELIAELRSLMPFIQADSIGPATQKRLVAVLGGGDGHGLVRWFNEELGSQTGDLLREVIQLIVRPHSTAIGLSGRDRATVVKEAANKLPAKVDLLESICFGSAAQRQPQQELDPLFVLYNRMKKAAGKEHKKVTDGHVAEAYIDSLGKDELSKLFAAGDTRETLVAQYITKLRNCRKNHPERLWRPGN